jgi:hypothetical protein
MTDPQKTEDDKLPTSPDMKKPGPERTLHASPQPRNVGAVTNPAPVQKRPARFHSEARRVIFQLKSHGPHETQLDGRSEKGQVLFPLEKEKDQKNEAEKVEEMKIPPVDEHGLRERQDNRETSEILESNLQVSGGMPGNISHTGGSLGGQDLRHFSHILATNVADASIGSQTKRKPGFGNLEDSIRDTSIKAASSDLKGFASKSHVVTDIGKTAHPSIQLVWKSMYNTGVVPRDVRSVSGDVEKPGLGTIIPHPIRCFLRYGAYGPTHDTDGCIGAKGFDDSLNPFRIRRTMTPQK